MGLGAAVANPNIIPGAVDELTQIAGQRAVVTRSRKSISNFKLRENMPIGCMVTLRRERMWEFLDRLIAVAIPRMPRLQGDQRQGLRRARNYTLGLREQIIFPRSTTTRSST